MSLEERIAQDMKEAMKAKDKAALRGLRAIKAAILLARTDGSGRVLNEDSEIKMLQKLAKQRKESIEIYETNGRDDLALIEKEELEVIEKYLPKQLDEAKLEEILQGIISETGAESMRDMGKVMGIATKRLAGQADGRTVSTLVKKLLSQ